MFSAPGVLLFAALVATEPLAAPVLLEGDAVLTAAVGRCLMDLGLASARRPAKGEVVVHLLQQQNQIRLRIRALDGRSTERLVDSPRIAAAVIDSWSRPEWTESLLAPRAIASDDGSRAAGPAAAVLSRGSYVPNPQSLVTLRIGGEFSLASDGSTWQGVTVGACRRIWSSCLGVGARVARDITGAGATYGASPAALTRLGADLLATWDIMGQVGPLALISGAGAGVGWLSVTGDYDLHDGHVDAYGLRAEVHLLLRIPVGAQLAFEGGAWAGLSPQAQRAPLVDDGFTMPGEPLGFLRGGIGLRYGGP